MHPIFCQINPHIIQNNVCVESATAGTGNIVIIGRGNANEVNRHDSGISLRKQTQGETAGIISVIPSGPHPIKSGSVSQIRNHIINSVECLSGAKGD